MKMANRKQIQKRFTLKKSGVKAHDEKVTKTIYVHTPNFDTAIIDAINSIGVMIRKNNGHVTRQMQKKIPAI
jgi:hypothetical protein